jgi:ArsR family transcriptional regulator
VNDTAPKNNQGKGSASSALALGVQPLSGEEADEELARLAKAIGHPVRIRILRLLAAQPGCMCGAIFREIPLAQSTISQHLKVLREAGLIEGELDLPRICYCAKTDALQRLKQLVLTL